MQYLSIYIYIYIYICIYILIYIYIYIDIVYVYIYIYLFIYIVVEGIVINYVYIYIYIYIYTHIHMYILHMFSILISIGTSPGRFSPLEGTKGVPRNGGHKQQLVRSCVVLKSLHVQTLTLTDVQTPFLGTPLIPLKSPLAVFQAIIYDYNMIS